MSLPFKVMKDECTIVSKKNLLWIMLEKWTSLDITGVGAIAEKHTRRNKAGKGTLMFYSGYKENQFSSLPSGQAANRM